MKRSGITRSRPAWLARHAGVRPTPLSKKPIRRKKRTPSEFNRIYGSRARVRWVKSLPCVVCGMGPCDNAHSKGGGMGRKGDYQTIVPLCCMPLDHPYSPGYPRGHHGLLHQVGIKTFEKMYSISLDDEARRINARWQSLNGVRSA